MAFYARALGIAAIAAGLAIAPAAHAEHWHGGYPHGGYPHHHGGNAAAGAIIGGLVGLGVGAAIASNGGYAPGYYAPYGYYAPPPGYYTPPPPAVYYGY
jgi:hypothetical protein